jgi:hypothetical protein
MNGLPLELTKAVRLRGPCEEGKSPDEGRDDCVAGVHNFTALPRISQSSAMQRSRLFQWLKDNQQITTLQARNELGIMYPAGRV